MRSRVDLPAPFSPIRARIWPPWTSRSTSRSARTFGKALARPRISRRGAGATPGAVSSREAGGGTGGSAIVTVGSSNMTGSGSKPVRTPPLRRRSLLAEAGGLLRQPVGRVDHVGWRDRLGRQRGALRDVVEQLLNGRVADVVAGDVERCLEAARGVGLPLLAGLVGSETDTDDVVGL